MSLWHPPRVSLRLKALANNLAARLLPCFVAGWVGLFPSFPSCTGWGAAWLPAPHWRAWAHLATPLTGLAQLPGPYTCNMPRVVGDGRGQESLGVPC